MILSRAKHLPTAKQFAFVKKLAKLYKIKLKICRLDSEIDGQASFRHYNKTGTLLIELNMMGKCPVQAFFHELGHLHCAKNRIWSAYHYFGTARKLTAKQLIAHNNTAYKAERWVERWGRRQMRQHFPKLIIYGIYSTKADHDWFNNYYLRYFKHLLRKKQ